MLFSLDMKFLVFNLFVVFSLYSQVQVDLETALDTAYEYNKQLLILEEMVNEAKAGKIISLAAWLPSLEATSLNFFNASYQTFYNMQNTFATIFSLSQNLFETDAYYDLKISDLNLKKVEFLYETLKNEITYDVKSSYYKIIYDLEKVATQKEHVDLLAALLQRMKDRLKIGEAIALNVNQSQVAYITQKTKFVEAVKILKDDLHAFSKLLGFNPEEIEFVIRDERFDFAKYPFLEKLFLAADGSQEVLHLFSKSTIDELEREIIVNNPSLKTQNMALKMMNETVKKSLGEYFPKLQFVANYGGLPNPFVFYPSSSFTNQVFQFGVGLELKWNLFDGLKREGTIKKTKHQKMASFYELENITQKVAVDFSNSIIGIETAIAQVISSQDNVGLAEETRKLAFDQLEIGYYTIYDYQIALDQLVQVKNMLSEAKYQLFRSYFDLEKVVGKPINEKELHHGKY